MSACFNDSVAVWKDPWKYFEILQNLYIFHHTNTCTTQYISRQDKLQLSLNNYYLPTLARVFPGLHKLHYLYILILLSGMDSFLYLHNSI